MKVGKGRNVQKLFYPGYKTNLGYMIDLKKISFNVPYTCNFFGVASLCRSAHLWRGLFVINLTAMTALCQMLRKYSVVIDIAALGEVAVSCPAQWFMWFILCTLSMVVCRTVTEIVDVFLILILWLNLNDWRSANYGHIKPTYLLQ